MDSQNMGLGDLKEDILEIKANIKELAGAMTTIALHSQRLDGVEIRLGKMELGVESAWEQIHTIKTTCIMREPVYRFGAKKMDAPSISNNQWLDMFLGSALRNGIWIIATGLIMAYLTEKLR